MIFQIFNEEWLQSLDTFEEIMWFLVLYLILLLLMAIFLKIALGFFSKARHTNFGQVFVTAFLITLVFALTFLFLELGWLAWLIALFLTFLIISVSHNIGFLSAIVVTVLAFLIYILVAFVIGLIIGTTLIVLPF
ncbi:hypothetical protein LCGC14_0956160 [marine sediment metagenome]|uniref:Uncharacterized protein n=1 Tax=marine sediment metagenome TaxID=412755 RepID=A0A0F9QZ60_9ZZZZ|nr:hypothetical protein [bacterium]